MIARTFVSQKRHHQTIAYGSKQRSVACLQGVEKFIEDKHSKFRLDADCTIHLQVWGCRRTYGR